MTTIDLILKERPAWALAYLQRCGQGEIYVRRAGNFVERRYFDLQRCPCGELMDHGDVLCRSCESKR